MSYHQTRFWWRFAWAEPYRMFGNTPPPVMPATGNSYRHLLGKLYWKGGDHAAE